MTPRLCLLLVLASGCSGGATNSPDARQVPDAPPPDPTVLRVAGEYTTAVTLGQNTCSNITVENRPTSVAHVPGATALTVTHAGQSYPGTVERNGAFTTPSRPVGTPAETHNLRIAGQFSTTGFEATVDVDVTSGGAPLCTYSVSWVGTKQGAPNIIPE